ncbi:uncharacterized protein CANTADRAFT_37194, partial [Suhomyces tanzawaensis NRRL Y-17324]
AVYDLSASATSDVRHVQEEEAFMYLADRFGMADEFKLGKGKKAEELIEFIDAQYAARDGNSPKTNLIVTIDGVEHPHQFLESRQPAFMVEDAHNGLAKKLPNKLAHALKYESVDLTHELKLVTSAEASGPISHFKYFNEKLLKTWEHFKSSSFNPAMLSLISDRFFIAELSQLIHLTVRKGDLSQNDFVFANLNSLLSIGKKTGFDSNTYKFSNKVLGDFLVQLSKDFDILLFVKSSEKSAPMSQELRKRSQELDDIFDLNDLSKRSAGSVCFISEEACKVSTSDCASHGVCSKIGGGCWSCLCSPSFNKTTQRTTKWAGADCSKQDISAQANLFLWTTLGLLTLLVGGLQLLYSVGSEALPGVLDAATSSKKN